MLQGVPGALLPAMKKKRTSPKAKTPERIIQAQVDAYIELRGLFCLRIPDWLLSSIMQNQHIPIHVKRALSDILKGMPDNLILSHDRRSLPLELKTDIGKLSASQREVKTAIGTVVARSFEEARAEIDRFKDGK